MTVYDSRNDFVKTEIQLKVMYHEKEANLHISQDTRNRLFSAFAQQTTQLSILLLINFLSSPLQTCLYYDHHCGSLLLDITAPCSANICRQFHFACYKILRNCLFFIIITTISSSSSSSSSS